MVLSTAGRGETLWPQQGSPGPPVHDHPALADHIHAGLVAMTPDRWHLQINESGDNIQDSMSIESAIPRTARVT